MIRFHCPIRRSFNGSGPNESRIAPAVGRTSTGPGRRRERSRLGLAVLTRWLVVLILGLSLPGTGLDDHDVADRVPHHFSGDSPRTSPAWAPTPRLPTTMRFAGLDPATSSRASAGLPST